MQTTQHYVWICMLCKCMDECSVLCKCIDECSLLSHCVLQDDETPVSLTKLAALLLKHNLVNLETLYPHVRTQLAGVAFLQNNFLTPIKSSLIIIDQQGNAPSNKIV